jgi:twinkle protein
MADKERGARVLDMRAGKSIQTVADEDIDFKAYEQREARSKVIPAEDLAEEGRRRMLLGYGADPGLTLPWLKLDGKVVIRPGKLALWAGWTHHGKSKMLQQVMLHAMHDNERVCVASMEEEMTEVWCDMGRMACGCQDPEPREIGRWVEFCTQSLWFYDQQGVVDSSKIRAVIRYCAEELKVTQFVVDSLMMLAVDRDDYEAQSRFIGELKSLAKDTSCTIHLVAHLRKRDGKGGDEHPGSIHEIAGAHDIGSKADYVFNVWRDKLRKDETKPSCVLTVEKQRGRVNWLGKVGLSYHSNSRQFVDDTHSFPMQFWGQREREPGCDDF